MPKQANEDPESLYFRSFAECFAFKGWSGIGNYKFLAILTLSIMAVFYYIFR
jgi:SSS family solute:Na+ symporter